MKFSEDLLEFIFDRSSEGIFQSTSQGHYLRVNHAMATIYGYASPEDMVQTVTNIAEQIYVDAADREHFKKLLSKEGKVHGFEAHNKRKDGSLIWTSTKGTAIRDSKGKVQSFIGFVRDISVVKNAETARDESEVRYGMLVDQLPAAVYIESAVGNNPSNIYISPRIEKISGYSPTEWIGSPGFWRSIIHPDDLGRFTFENDGADKSGKPFNLEYRIIHKDGRTVWVHDISALAYTPEGLPSYWHGVVLDITEQKNLQEAIRQSEERYHALVENIPAIVFLDPTPGSREAFYINPQVEAMLGYSQHEWTGDRHLWEKILHPQDRDAVLEQEQKTAQAGTRFSMEYRMLAHDGRVVWVREESALVRDRDGRADYWQGVILDITNRKEAQQALEHQLHELTILHALALAGTSANDEDELITLVTESVGQSFYPDILGFLLVDPSGEYYYPHASYRGMTIPDLMHSYKVEEGIAGRAATTGKLIRIGDVREIPGFIPVNPLARSELCVPMLIDGRVIGMINAESIQADFFSEADERFLLTVASQVGTAIERIRKGKSETDQRLFAEALQDIAQALNSTLEFDKVLDRILENIGQVLPSEAANIMLIEDGRVRSIRHRGFIERGLDSWIEALRFDISDEDIAEVIKTRKPRLTANTGNAAAWKSFPETEWVKSQILAPIQDDLDVIGFITLEDSQKNFFNQEHAQRLMAFTAQAATAIRNARLFQAEQQRRQESETLRESVAIVASTLDRKQAIDLILDQLARVVQFDSASVQILHEGFLEIVGGRGWPSENAVLGLKFAVPGNNPNTRIIQEKRSVVISGNIDESYKPFQSELHNHIQSWLGVPLITHGTVIGMLSLDSAQPDHFSEEHIRLATAFANHAAIAIDNARVHEQSELQIRRLTILRDVDTAIASSLDLRVTLGLLIDHARSQLKMDAIEILVYNPKLQLLESTAQRGLEGSSLPRGLRIGESLAGHIALNRKPLQISDLNTSNEYSHLKPGGMEKFTSYIGLPLIGKGQIKGVMQVFFIHAYTPDANWREFIQMLAGQAAIAIDSTQLFENLQVSNQEITLAYDTTLEGWGKAMELRDRETQGHTQRVTTLTVKLARRMGVREADLAHIRRGVLLHDIGKMGIPDRILHKNGPLDETEWQLMRQHPQFAFDLLNPIAFLRPALEIPFCHHEKWDGTGYPRGLKGVDIPLTARIFAVVDVWDALSSDRAYRPAWGKNEVIAYLQSESNKHFDPSVVNAFLRILDDESGYENIK